MEGGGAFRGQIILIIDKMLTKKIITIIICLVFLGVVKGCCLYGMSINKNKHVSSKWVPDKH